MIRLIEALEELDDVFLDSLDMHMTAWKSLLCQRFATGIISKEHFDEMMAKVPSRIEKIKKYVRKLEGEKA
jgi:hypothetical protein